MRRRCIRVVALALALALCWMGCRGAERALPRAAAKITLIERLSPTSRVRAPSAADPELAAALRPVVRDRALLMKELENPNRARGTVWGYDLWWNGSFFFEAELWHEGAALELVAAGTVVNGVGSHVVVLSDGEEIGEAFFEDEWSTVHIPIPKPGMQRIEIRFDNDFHPEEDRSFKLKEVRLRNAIETSVLGHYEKLRTRHACPDYPDLPEEVQHWLVSAKVGKETRPALFAPAPTEYRIPVDVPPRATLELGGAVLPSEWDLAGDGVELTVEIVGSQRTEAVVSQYLDPKAFPAHRRWFDWKVPLERWAGQRVEVVLRTRPGYQAVPPFGESTDPFFDAALWSNPLIVHEVEHRRLPSFVMISFDTLRADRLGAYGHPAGLSPNVDRLARRGTTFARCITQAPYTLGAHMSLFTGQYMSNHGYLGLEDGIPTGAGLVTVAEALRDAGYRTAAFVDPGWLSPELRVEQGFETFDESGGGVEAVFERGTRWLERSSGVPFFLFLHTYEIHTPYAPPPVYAKRADPGYAGRMNGSMAALGRIYPIKFQLDRFEAVAEQFAQMEPPIRKRDLEHVIRLYEAGVRYSDASVDDLLAALQAHGAADDTHLIVLSDHGEELGEHQMFAYHNQSLHDELLHVPLVWTGPEVPAGRLQPETVGLIDVYPTMLQLAGLPEPSGISGRSLAAAFSRRPLDDRPVGAERFVDRSWGRSLSSDRLKLIDEEQTGVQLYDLDRDPGERASRQKLDPQLVIRVRELLRRSLEAAGPGGAQEVRQVSADEEMIETLRSLGYLD
jgi:arylsulfatase A-like enzyme